MQQDSAAGGSMQATDIWLWEDEGSAEPKDEGSTGPTGPAEMEAAEEETIEDKKEGEQNSMETYQQAMKDAHDKKLEGFGETIEEFAKDAKAARDEKREADQSESYGTDWIHANAEANAKAESATA